MKSKKISDSITGTLQSRKAYSFKEIKSMSANKLKELCLKFNVDHTLPKNAKIVFLCHCIGVSVTGSDKSTESSRKRRTYDSLTNKHLEELEQLTPKVLFSVPPSGWSVDLSKVPDIEDTIVKKYLLQTEVLDKKSSRTYKLSRPYQLKHNVHSIKYFENETSDVFGVLAARCNASQSTCQDDIKVIHIIVDKISGEPYSAYCTCTVGFSETCGHVGATLFRVSELVASGVTALNELPTCTEKLCEWTKPKGSKAEPGTIDSLEISKRVKKIRRTVESYGQIITKKEPPTYDAVAELHANLIAATHHLGQYVPAVHVLNPGRFKTEREPSTPAPEMLKDIISADSHLLAFSNEITIETTPISITRLPHGTFKAETDNGYERERVKFFEAAKTLPCSQHELDYLTMGQSSNKEWHEQRRGCITGTKFSRVLKCIEKRKDDKKLVHEILDPKENKHLGKISSIKWGRTHEEHAKKRYIDSQSKFHRMFQIEEHGLIVSPECNFVRASPDGVVRCICHKPILLEIKCPYSARYMEVEKAITEKKIKYLQRTDSGDIELKVGGGDGYYEQIQGLLGIMELSKAHLVIWTKKDLKIVVVDFDPIFYTERLMPALQTFFFEKIIPAILINATVEEFDSDDNEELTAALLEFDTNTPCTRVPDVIISAPEQKPNINTLVAPSTTSYKCKQCNKILPDDDILPDNSNASVGCDCPNCGGCDTWFCWPCARYTEEWVEENVDWYCPHCTRECDIVY